MLKNVRANMLVAMAVRGAIPTSNIAGTVMRDVLPVTTLTPLVTKKTAAKSRTCRPVILSLLAQRPYGLQSRGAFPSFATVSNCPFRLRRTTITDRAGRRGA
jgi:hypothetical protein